MSYSKSTFFLSLIFFCTLSQNFFSQSVCSYGYRKRITFNPAQVSGPSDLIDFPVIIKITGDNDLRVVGSSGHVQSASGYDIIFTSSDGVTQLNHQLVSYASTTGGLECWVKVPILSTTYNTDIYMYYGNSAISTDQSSTSTWSNGYAAVWHFDNSVNNSSSVAGLNGTNNGSTNTATALFGSNARSFASASNQYIDVTPYNSAYDLNTEITVSAWVRLASNGVDQKIAGNQDNTNGGWKFGVFSDNKLEFEIRNSSNSPFLSRSASGGSALSNNTWYYVVGQFSDAGDFINTYLNGAIDRNYSTTANCAMSGGTLKIGREPFGTSAFLNGIMDELRISNVIRSADWIATEYVNQNSPGPGTFYTISAEPKVWNGGTNTNYNTASNWLNNSTPSSGDDVIINNGTNQPTLQGNAQVNSIFVRTGATLSLSNRQLAVRSDITNCGTINGGTGEVLFNSTSSFAQNQNMSGSGTYNLTNLTVNNTFATSPSLTLSKDVNVSGLLTLTSGIVYTSSTNILALGTTATSTSGSASSFISGPISKVGTANFVFPTGKGTKWRRASVTNISASSTFRAEYFNAAYANTTPVNSPLNNVSTTEYWQVDRIVGAGNANLSLYWESATLSGINNCPDLTIARWNGASWDERPGTTAAASSCSGAGTGTVVSTALITAFSPFTFASKLSTVNPLPVELIAFTAECGAKNIILNWSTATETNNDHFIIEQSVDGESWQNIGQVKGAGTAQMKHVYSFITPPGLDRVLYFRLSQVDYDGGKKTFTIISSNCFSSGNKMLIYPNPAVKDITLQFDLLKDYETGLIKVIDNLGRICLQQSVGLVKGKTSQVLPLNLEAGSYTVLLFSEKLILPAQRLVVE